MLIGPDIETSHPEIADRDVAASVLNQNESCTVHLEGECRAVLGGFHVHLCERGFHGAGIAAFYDQVGYIAAVNGPCAGPGGG